MQLGQMIYTSCRKGFASGPGLQTQAVSRNVSDDQRYQVEGLNAYEIPRLPPQASARDIARLCLPEFRFTRFSGGVAAVTRLTYAGTDYSGRDGNFIAHSLIIPDLTILSYPIDLIAWRGWIDEVSDTPPNLAPVELDEIETSRFSLAKISRFLKSDKQYQQQLPILIQACLSSRAENRTVVIRDKPENLAIWIACLTKAFPSRIDEPFQFSTYSNRLSTDFDVQCTTESSEFDLADDVFNRQAFVFDFCKSRFSSVEANVCRLARSQSNFLMTNLEKATEFGDFVDKIAQRSLLEKLPSIYECFESVILGSGDISSQHIGTLVNLASNCREAEQFSIIERLTESIEDQSENNYLESRRDVARQLANCDDKLFPVSTNCIASCLKNLIWHDLQYSGGNCQSIDDSLSTFLGSPVEFDGEDLTTMSDFIRRRLKSGTAIDEIFEFVARRLERAGKRPVYLQREILLLARDAVKIDGPENTIDALLRLAKDQPVDEFAILCMELSGPKYTEASLGFVGASLVEILDSKSTRHADKIRSMLAKKKAHHVLISELNSRRRSDSEIQPFLKQLDKVLPKIMGSSPNEVGNILRDVWDGSRAEDRFRIATWLIGNPKLLQLVNRNLVSEVIAQLARVIPVDPKEWKHSKLAKNISSACHKLSIQPPTIIRIRDFIEELRACQELEQARDAWRHNNVKLSGPHEKSVALLILECLLPWCKTPKQHWQIINWCGNVVPTEAIVLAAYRAYLSSVKMRKVEYVGGVSFAKVAIGIEHVHAPSQSFKQVAAQSIDPWLEAVSDRTFDRIHDDVSRWLCDHEFRKLRDWKSRCAAIKKSRDSVFGIVTRLLGLVPKPKKGAI